MTSRILFAGFGGQGILFSGKQCAKTGMQLGKCVTWLPSYGPEQRGGTCNCSVIISDEDIGSPLVNTPDILITFNAPSFDKFEPKVVAGGAVFSDSTLISKKSERSDISAYTIPATELANEMNAPKLANVIMLGYVIAKTNIFDFDYFAEKLTASVPESKAELRELNKKALLLGYNYAE